MPIYEYQCMSCKHVQEEYLSITNHPDSIECEKCGSKSKRIYSGTQHVIFKGDDWADKRGKTNDKTKRTAS